MVSPEPDRTSTPKSADARVIRHGEPTALKEVLDRSATMKMIRRYMRQSGHREAWRELVGESVARQARALSYRAGKLFVEVCSAPLLQELSTFRKAELIDRLRQREGYEEIVDIVFRHGGS